MKIGNSYCCNDQCITPTTTTIPISTTVGCLWGSVPDGYGGCYYVDECEAVFGGCNCEYGNSFCCHDQCVTTITPTAPITVPVCSWNQRLIEGDCYDYVTCEKSFGACNCKENHICCDLIDDACYYRQTIGQGTISTTITIIVVLMDMEVATGRIHVNQFLDHVIVKMETLFVVLLINVLQQQH